MNETEGRRRLTFNEVCCTHIVTDHNYQSSVVDPVPELQTKVHKDFTITEKALLGGHSVYFNTAVTSPEILGKLRF